MIYLDYNATTLVDERVLAAMLPYFSNKFGNAASNNHIYGWRAKDAVKEGREKVAKLINCLPQEIVFTSGATEAINLAIKGIAEAYYKKGAHIVTCQTEHKAVIDTTQYLQKKEAIITSLQVDSNGEIDLNKLEEAITEHTILVSIMIANNETGVIHPIKEISKIVHQKGAILFCDATQAIGKIKIDVDDLGIDVLCMSAHKFYGPKGVGALYIRRKNPRVTIAAQLHGGGHENARRSGTLNVPGIVGLGTACDLAAKEMIANQTHIEPLRNLLEYKLLEIEGASLNGSIKNRLYNTSNICFGNVKAVDIMNAIKTVAAVSSGSACSSAESEPSHVLIAMGLLEEQAYSSIRFSLGKYVTETEIKSVAEAVYDKIMELKQREQLLNS